MSLQTLPRRPEIRAKRAEAIRAANARKQTRNVVRDLFAQQAAGQPVDVTQEVRMPDDLNGSPKLLAFGRVVFSESFPTPEAGNCSYQAHDSDAWEVGAAVAPTAADDAKAEAGRLLDTHHKRPSSRVLSKPEKHYSHLPITPTDVWLNATGTLNLAEPANGARVEYRTFGGRLFRKQPDGFWKPAEGEKDFGF